MNKTAELLEEARCEMIALVNGAKGKAPAVRLSQQIQDHLAELEDHEENILEEANRIVGINEGRTLRYGHPAINFSHTADMWHAAFGWDVDAQKIGLAIILLKVSRECNMHGRDNLTDIAGYARTLEMVHEYFEDQAGIAEAQKAIDEHLNPPHVQSDHVNDQERCGGYDG